MAQAQSAMRSETIPDNTIGDTVSQSASKIGDTAASARDDLAQDMRKLKDDIASIQQTLVTFASKAGGEAMKTAQNVGSSLSAQVGEVASDVATTATQQAKTFASELETMARRNPLATIGGTLLVGVVIGMMSRGRG